MYTRWNVEIADSFGNVIATDGGHNIFHDEGEEYFSKLVTGATSVGTNWYLGLDNRVGNSYSVSGVTTGSDANGVFTVSGDVTSEVTVGEPIRITGSTGNDGVYHIKSATYDSGATETNITVYENVTDGTADGSLVFFVVTESDTLSSLSGEPDGTNGYSRQSVSTDTSGFSVSQSGGDWGFETATQTITASGGTIGPVNTLFLCTSSDDTGWLLTTLPLNKERSISDGTSINIGLRQEWGESYR